MPYAQLHYPFENKDKFEKNFPADFIAEGLDQVCELILCGTYVAFCPRQVCSDLWVLSAVVVRGISAPLWLLHPLHIARVMTGRLFFCL